MRYKLHGKGNFDFHPRPDSLTEALNGVVSAAI